MIESIRRRFDKTPQANDTFLIRKIPAVTKGILNGILESEYAGEGVFGIEYSNINAEKEFVLLTPSWYREDVGELINERALANITNEAYDSCYHVALMKPPFLPLFTERDASIFDRVVSLETSGPLFVQMLFTKRMDRWQEEMIYQYAAYKEGIETPSTSKWGLKLQNKMIHLLDRVSGYDSKRNTIEEVHDKILGAGYRFELRIAGVGNIDLEIEKILSEWNYFNRLGLISPRDKDMFVARMENSRFSELTVNQILGEAEIRSLLIGESVVKQQKVMEVVSQESIPSPYQLLPMGEKLEREINTSVVKELPETLKRAKAIKGGNIKILDVELGVAMQRVTFEIPGETVFTDIKKKLDDIEAVLGANLSIVKGKEPNTITFLIPCEQRDILYLKELLEDPAFLEFARENPLPFVCGLDMYNQPVYKCLTKAPQLLMAGATGSGKSVFLVSLIITLLLTKTPDELRMYLIDPKKVDLSKLGGMAHVERVITDLEKAEQLLCDLVGEMESRYDLLSEAGVRNIAAYNKKADEKMPYIVCCIDEYNDLIMQFPDVEDHIVRLGQKARAAGIHLIIATQRPDKDVVTGVLKSNLPSRISFSLNSNNDYKTVFGKGIPFSNLLGMGDGVVTYDGQTEEFIRFQAPVLTLDDDQEEDALDQIAEYLETFDVKRLQLKEVIRETPIEKLRRIIEETGETRINELRKIMGIRINDVSDLVKQLEAEGFLVKKGRSYVIAENEEK